MAGVLRKIYDEWTCQMCGFRAKRDGRITAHHIVRRSDGGADSIENLITLCRQCHNQIEFLYDRKALEPQTCRLYIKIVRTAFVQDGVYEFVCVQRRLIQLRRDRLLCKRIYRSFIKGCDAVVKYHKPEIFIPLAAAA